MLPLPRQELRETAERQRRYLDGRIRRARVRLNAQDRRQRTRRLILLGTLVEHEVGDDEASRARLMARPRCLPDAPKGNEGDPDMDWQTAIDVVTAMCAAYAAMGVHRLQRAGNCS